ncbi:pyridoxal-phosphate dependent enzyme [Streptomyces halobius]|uniref:Pyridoxal-phosphate dependent enzyme n=1 Tax=Streptomyces halobius TaxID=2879846 RepID=A0ABY4M6X8_9ACTN|nr:pyridoxal-phosphate dependent enzyme [Streptomyces halobius]UQA92140.1 pyridoxal-phosphate dependent enzyme [Streptomyces halobius]
MTIEHLASAPADHVDPYAVIDELSRLTTLNVGRVDDTRLSLRAVHGSPATETSFKSILGLGLLLLAKERGLLAEGRPVIESTSGSLGLGLAAAGRLLGHEVHLVSDPGIPAVTRRKIELAGAVLHLAPEPHPVLGFQQARDDLLQMLRAQHPDYYWTNQNDSPLNPEVYSRWVVPHLMRTLDFSRIAAGIFCVGSGGHFSALSAMLDAKGIRSYVADRHGSITFGGDPAPSILRGTGNQNRIPAVIDSVRDRVTGVFEVSDAQACAGVQELAARGISVGGSSGVCYMGARQLAAALGPDAEGEILTFFADRGELYGTTLLTWGDSSD